MIVTESPGRSCCGSCEKAYLGGAEPGCRVSAQMTSKRSPGHLPGMSVPGAAGKAAASGGYLAMHTNPPGGLAQYYRENVIGGPGAFVAPIDDFRTFGEAMIRKLVNEISDARPQGR